MTSEPVKPSQRWYKILYVQTILAVILGIAIGVFFPNIGKQLKPLSDGFIALIKMMIGPIIFCTVVHGIASLGDLRRLGRLGLKALDGLMQLAKTDQEKSTLEILISRKR